MQITTENRDNGQCKPPFLFLSIEENKKNAALSGFRAGSGMPCSLGFLLAVGLSAFGFCCFSNGNEWPSLPVIYLFFLSSPLLSSCPLLQTDLFSFLVYSLHVTLHAFPFLIHSLLTRCHPVFEIAQFV